MWTFHVTIIIPQARLLLPQLHVREGASDSSLKRIVTPTHLWMQPTEKLPDKFTTSQHQPCNVGEKRTDDWTTSSSFLCKQWHMHGMEKDWKSSFDWIYSFYHGTSTGMGFTDGERIMRKKKQQPHVFRFSSVSYNPVERK